MSEETNESEILDGNEARPDAIDDESMLVQQRSWFWPAVAALVAVLAFVFAIVVVVRTDDGGTPSVSQGTGTAPVVQNEACDGFTVQLDPNYSNNVFSHGVSPETEKMRKEIARGAKQDPRIFQVYYNASPLGKADPIKDVALIAPLKNGQCYTPDGVAAYNKWIVLWNVTKLTNDELPAHGVNTGAVANGQAFTQNGAIPAGTGVKVVYQDATGNAIGTHWVRLECGNVVTPGAPIPNIPPVTTVPPPPPPTVPPTTGTPPPTTETPPPPTTTTPPPLTPKDPSLDPYPQGNAPQGGGPNDQPGPGPSNVPTQPPSTPRTNPPRPIATAVPGTPAPTRVSTPVTAPPPEPGVNGNGTGTTTIPHVDESGSVTTSVVITTAVPKPQ